jgi:hypothetical protein
MNKYEKCCGPKKTLVRVQYICTNKLIHDINTIIVVSNSFIHLISSHQLKEEEVSEKEHSTQKYHFQYIN